MSNEKSPHRWADAWKREHTTNLTIRLNHNTDADILQRIEHAESKAGTLKRLIRAGMKTEEERK